MKYYAIAFVVMAACGSVADNKLPDAPSGSDAQVTSDTLPIDAAPPRCDPAKPFGTPVLVTELNSMFDEGGVALSTDELTAVFASSRTAASDLYIATRTDRDAAFGSPVLLDGVNTEGRESRPTLLGDNLTLYAESRPNPNTPFSVVRSTRASATAPFSALAPVAGINAANASLEPFIIPDGTALYFSSDRVTAGEFNLYVATGTAGSFGTPALVTGTSLNTRSAENAPTLTPDQLNLYFASDRAGNMNQDIWYATRASLVTGFGAPVLISALSSMSADVPDWVSADNCVLYFHRNIGVVASNFEIFVAKKPL